MSSGAPWRDAAAAARKATGAPVRVVVVGRGGDVLDAEARWAGLSGVADDGAVLVPPDDMVGWRSHTLPVMPPAR